MRAALTNSGFAFPQNKRITVSLAPADLSRESGRFDLPIALGILAAEGQLDPQRLAMHEFAGELSLAGELRPVRGALALALAMRRLQVRRTLVLPRSSAQQAACTGGLEVCEANHLLDVVRAMRADADDAALPRATPISAAAPSTAPDLCDVKGQAAAKRALEIAAAGGHSLLMVGPPGSGKSMLAQRLPGLLPTMTEDEALASAALLGLSPRGFDPQNWRQRPVRAPHHTASAVALVGGGSPPRPGEISLAHGGALFLDELPEFARVALEALLDRIDMQVEVGAVQPSSMLSEPDGEPSARIAARVALARQRQVARQGGVNPQLDVGQIDVHCALDAAAARSARSVIDGRADHSMKPRLRLAGSKLARFGKTPSSCVSEAPSQRPSVAPI